MALTDVTDVKKTWLEWAIKAFEDAQENYERYEAYYNGEHELEFATDRWQDVFGNEFEEFADNWCGVVVDALAHRLKITGWDCDDSKECREAAQDIWDFNDLTNEEQELYVSTITKGDGYAIVWPSEDEPGKIDVVVNDALEVNVFYDPADRRKISRAAKHWWDDNGDQHLNLYFTDRTEQYMVPDNVTAAQLAGFDLPDIPLPQGWHKSGADIPNTHNLVPVFHFRNRRQNATHGLSEISSVIPVQNAVNKLLMDLMVGSEFGSFRQKWMTGAGHPADGWKAGTGRVWATTDPNARFGEFGQIDLEPIMHSIDALVGHIAKITATPMHYLRTSGDMPSGEALKTAESGLVTKGTARQTQFGSSWTKVMNFAVELKLGKKEPHPITPIWESVETRHDLEQAQTAQLKAVLGIPLEVLWKEHFGYSDEQIEEFKKTNADLVARVISDTMAQTGQQAPGADILPPGLNLTQVAALLGKGVTSKTEAGESTVNPQPNTSPPASPTRRSTGFRD